jgi:hypothetical protein
MQHYRAYQIVDDGRVYGCINLVCDGEEDAKRQARALVSRYRIELWRLDKRVAQFDARQGERAAPPSRQGAAFAEQLPGCGKGPL